MRKITDDMLQQAVKLILPNGNLMGQTRPPLFEGDLIREVIKLREENSCLNKRLHELEQKLHQR